MKKIIVLSCLCFLAVQIIADNKKGRELKIMTFNIWLGGGKSIKETAKVFVDTDADIIGIQESYRENKNTAKYIADSLGWYSYEYNDSQTIVSKYPIIDTTANKYGVKIQLDKLHDIWMFNIHLMYCPYEPYQLNGIEYCGGPLLTSADQAEASAWKTRGKEVEDILSDLKDAQKDKLPIFLTGDFNEPSFLDWTPKAFEAGLHKYAVQWPATKALIERGSLKDSYRTVYPDEVKNQGNTWTSLPEPEIKEYNEIYDRIDFVLFYGNKVKVKSSQIVGENSPHCDIKFTDYPSDHRAVLSSFTLK